MLLSLQRPVFIILTETLKSSHRLVNASKRRTQKKMLVYTASYLLLYTRGESRLEDYFNVSDDFNVSSIKNANFI